MISTFIVIVGNPTSGFTFYGPFQTSAFAEVWAENHLKMEFWVTELEEPFK